MATVINITPNQSLAQTRQRFLAVAPVDHDADAHLARVDHADVDAALGQGAEHAPGHAGVRPHADAQHEQLGDVGVGDDAARPGRCRATTSSRQLASARSRSACAAR